MGSVPTLPIKWSVTFRIMIKLGDDGDGVACTVPKSRAAVDYTLTGVEPHGPTRSV